MLANHTSIRHLFNHCLSQYDKLMKRKAFLDNYKVGALLFWSFQLLRQVLPVHGSGSLQHGSCTAKTSSSGQIMVGWSRSCWVIGMPLGGVVGSLEGRHGWARRVISGTQHQTW